MSKKPRIALVAMGVMGGGPIGDGIPVLVDLFGRLSQYYDIVYYTLQPIDASKVPPKITIRQATRWRLPGRLKYFLVMLRLAVDHWVNGFHLVFAVSAYPTGSAAIKMGSWLNIPVAVQLIALEAVALPEIGDGNLLHPWLAKVTRRVCKEAEHLIVVADYQATVAKRDLPTDRQILSLPLRINPQRFFYKKRRINFPVEFIHIAYYNPIKGQDVMFKAFAIVAQKVDCRLTIFGDGYSREEVHKMLDDLQIADKVFFKGLIHQSEIPKVFEGAHILLHMARFETGCAVIQEAMASGVAVCGTDVGILWDIGDEYAAIVPVDNVEMMAEKMLKLVHDHDYYSSITDKAYQWISKYDNEWSINQYRSAIDQMLYGRV